MKFLVLIISILALGNGLVAAQEEVLQEPQDRYQVEIIILRHLQSAELPALKDQITDYRQFETTDTLLAQNQILAQAGRSETMAGVWNRLRSSAGYRPLLYRGWIQYATPISQPLPVRMHDDTAFEVIAQPGIGSGADPHYQLDGTIRFSKGRFYHIKLDLEWREPPPPTVDIASSPDSEAVNYRIHGLSQQRQVLLDAVTYFDTPWLGALVRVSELEEPAPAPDGE